jgi:hypothetical protein
MVGTYEDEFAARIVVSAMGGIGSSSGGQLLNTIVQHALWAAGAIDSCCARLALQALQTMAIYQSNSMRKGLEGFGLNLSSEIFPRATERLLEMLLFPASCEYGISWDRVDGCANALVVLIALDPNRFLHCINSLVQQQEEYLQPLLLAAFDKLTSTGGVSMVKIDKPNRQQFVKNFREFILSVRPLVLYH